MKYVFARFELAARIILFVIGLSAGMVILLVGARDALAASLKDVSVITGESLTLGDLFDGLDYNEDYVLGPAPSPGKNMVLDARTLYRIAVALELPWRPLSKEDKIVVRRAATVIGFDTIAEKLRQGLRDKGVKGDFNIHLSDGKPDMILPHNKPQSIELSTLQYDPQQDWFEATLAAPSAKNPEKLMTVMGQVERIISIPVLKNTLRNGDIIGAGDLEWIKVREKNLQHDLAMKAGDIVGMTPRRMVVAGKPVYDYDLEHPQIVQRGDTITIVYNEGPLLLTAKGRALQNGAKGDIVRVSNTNTSRSMDAFVTAQREVTVK